MSRHLATALFVAGVIGGHMPVAGQAPRSDASLEVVTLDDAIRRATRFDPEYIRALGRINNAQWSRTAAITQFVVPAIAATGSYSKFSTAFFNIGTGELATQIVQAAVRGDLTLFDGFGRVSELKRSNADVDASIATEVLQLYQTALDTETDYYDVLARKELVRVATERLERAEEQLSVARSRVLTGAAVQSDSLQLVLEVTRGLVDRLTEEAQLRVAQFQLGRRVGAPTAVDAAPFDASDMRALPLTEEQAIAEALSAGPDYQIAEAEERRAESALGVQRSQYLPEISLFGQLSAFDTKIFPSATVRSSYGVSVSVPIWTGGQREVQLSQARVERDVARAVREDIERGVRRDVAQAYATYVTARAVAILEQQAVAVSRENLRVQDNRYRSGATTILDLLTAQGDLTDAEARLVQARYTTWLALAGLESLLGRRLYDDRMEP
ncbi:MAG: TolC family protein [Gemmatimonadota bacterium]